MPGSPTAPSNGDKSGDKSGDKRGFLRALPRAYVKYVDYVSDKIGLVTMYLVFAMIAFLLIDAFTRNIINYPMFWCVEMAQFTLAAYYIVGGAHSLKNGEHVRMDLLYSRLSPRGKAGLDAFTAFFLIFYLVCLLVGAISSTAYSIKYDQKLFSMWNPSLIPIKIIMVCGIVLMLLQSISTFIKDVYKARGVSLA